MVAAEWQRIENYTSLDDRRENVSKSERIFTFRLHGLTFGLSNAFYH